MHLPLGLLASVKNVKLLADILAVQLVEVIVHKTVLENVTQIVLVNVKINVYIVMELV